MVDTVNHLRDSIDIASIDSCETVFLCETIEPKNCCDQNNGVSYDTVFTVIVTLSIFILGILIDRLLRWWDLLRKREKLKSYFEYHLKKVANGLIPKLRNGYRKFYQVTDINSGITTTPPKVLSGDFERLLQIDSSELFHVYQDKATFSKVLSQIHFVSKIQNEVQEFHTLALGQSNALREALKNLSDEYMGLLSEYGMQNRDNRDETYDLFNELVVYYYKELAGKRKLTDFHKKIIRPIQDHLVSTNKYQTDKLGKEIAEKGRRISHIYGELRHRSVEVRVQYRVFSKYMDEVHNTLESLLSDLK